MMHQLKRSQQLKCDIDTAWKFFSSPNNLSRITPSSLKFRVVDNFKESSIYEGMLINYKVSPFLGLQMNWQTLISQIDNQKSFTDFQQKGPYKFWNHFHEFIANDHGVLMKDTVDYELPFGIIGKIANSLFIRKKLKQIFDYRYQVLEKLFNSQTI